MASKFEFIINAILKVAKTDRTEGLQGGDTVVISGTKKGFLTKESIQVLIKRSQSDPDDALLVTADVDGNRQSEEILKPILFDVLKKSGMLDSRLQLKLDMLINQTGVGPLQFENGALKLKGSMAQFAVMGYQKHLAHSWPQLSDRIEIEVDGDSNGKEINFIHDLGWDDEDWKDFLYQGILLKAALDNCEKFGVEKLTFISNGEYVDYSISELRKKGY